MRPDAMLTSLGEAVQNRKSKKLVNAVLARDIHIKALEDEETKRNIALDVQRFLHGCPVKLGLSDERTGDVSDHALSVRFPNACLFDKCCTLVAHNCAPRRIELAIANGDPEVAE